MKGASKSFAVLRFFKGREEGMAIPMSSSNLEVESMSVRIGRQASLAATKH
jgi:hypothetical protein